MIRRGLWRCESCRYEASVTVGGLPAQPSAPDHVVPGHVACDKPEDRRQRPRVAAGAEIGHLSNFTVA